MKIFALIGDEKPWSSTHRKAHLMKAQFCAATLDLYCAWGHVWRMNQSAEINIEHLYMLWKHL